MLLTGGFYRCIKPINIQPVLTVLDQLPFVAICMGSTNPNKPPCSVVVPGAKLPKEIDALVEELNLGGVSHRVFFRKLAPGQSIPPHVDEWVPLGWRRFQIPLVSHPDILMRWPDENIEVYLEPGYLWEVDHKTKHEVVHRANVDRIHMQIDQIDAVI